MQVMIDSSMATFYTNRLAGARSASPLPESCLSEGSMHLAPNSNHSTTTAGITENVGSPSEETVFVFLV